MAIQQAFLTSAQPKSSAMDKILAGVQIANGIIKGIGDVQDISNNPAKLDKEFKQAQINKLNKGDTMSEYERGKLALDRRAQDAKLAEDRGALDVPGIGTARNADDAKKLKDAVEVKNSFDRKMDAMIALREKNGGGTMWSPTDTALGKQLASEALVDYKSMAKLGVLSDSDTKLINRIIPENPLGYSYTAGADDIMARMKSLKEGANADFSKNVGMRTRGGGLQQLVQSKPSPKVNDKIKTIAESKSMDELKLMRENAVKARR